MSKLNLIVCEESPKYDGHIGTWAYDTLDELVLAGWFNKRWLEKQPTHKGFVIMLYALDDTDVYGALIYGKPKRHQKPKITHDLDSLLTFIKEFKN